MSCIAPSAETLRRLSLNNTGLVHEALKLTGAECPSPTLDAKARGLAVVASIVALDGPTSCYQQAVDTALAAGATEDEVIGTLITVAPVVGSTRLVSAAPRLALALGHDLDYELQSWDI